MVYTKEKGEAAEKLGTSSLRAGMKYKYLRMK